MKIVVAPNAFKGSLTAVEAADAIASGVRKAMPAAKILKIPVADGGDGLIDVLVHAFKGERKKFKVANPLGRPIMSELFFIPGKKTAIIEMAKASGLALLKDSERNPMKTSTFGTGELIGNAVRLGAKKIILGIGGSATNDGGAGAAAALGIIFRDKNGNVISPCGGELIRIHSIDADGLKNLRKNLDVEVVCDVDNPLLGPQGASRIYGPQKGANPIQLELLENGLANLAKIIRRDLGVNVCEICGGGAAGGMGAGMHAFLGASLRKGSEIVMEMLDFESKIKSADLVLTAEGQIDPQTVFGKAPAVVAEFAKRQGIPCIAFAGSISGNISGLHTKGMTAVFSIAPGPVTLEESMECAGAFLERAAEQAIRAIFRV